MHYVVSLNWIDIEHWGMKQKSGGGWQREMRERVGFEGGSLMCVGWHPHMPLSPLLLFPHHIFLLCPIHSHLATSPPPPMDLIGPDPNSQWQAHLSSLYPRFGPHLPMCSCSPLLTSPSSPSFLFSYLLLWHVYYYILI